MTMLMMRGKPSHPHLQKQHQIKTTAIFLPIMCSNDVAAAIPTRHRHRRRPSEEPSSPKVGCMGQVKRTSKVVAFPSSALFLKQSDPLQNCSKNYNNTAVKQHSLKGFFSPKSLAGGPTNTASGTHKGKRVTADSNRVRSGTGARGQYGQKLVCRNQKTDKGSLVNLEELDPPLPVVKKLPALAKEEDGDKSLWKRRSGGAPLRSLQVQVVHQNQTSFLPAANTA